MHGASWLFKDPRLPEREKTVFDVHPSNPRRLLQLFGCCTICMRGDFLGSFLPRPLPTADCCACINHILLPRCLCVSSSHVGRDPGWWWGKPLQKGVFQEDGPQISSAAKQHHFFFVETWRDCQLAGRGRRDDRRGESWPAFAVLGTGATCVVDA